MKITKRKSSKLLFCLILSSLWISIPWVSTSHDPKNNPNPKIAALYLYNFLLFVDWPENAVSHSNTLKVGIYGDPQLYEAMYPMAGKEIKGKKMAVFSLIKPESLDESFQVLFVRGQDTRTVKEFLKKASGKPILTVSDRPGFSRLGAMVIFRDPDASQTGSGNQKRFIINLSAVSKSGLKIRSRLLRMSDIVSDFKP